MGPAPTNRRSWAQLQSTPASAPAGPAKGEPATGDRMPVPGVMKYISIVFADDETTARNLPSVGAMTMPSGERGTVRGDPIGVSAPPAATLKLKILLDERSPAYKYLPSGVAASVRVPRVELVT